MKLKVYKFKTRDIQHGEHGKIYEYKVYELPTGEALEPQVSTNDCWYSSIGEVEAFGNDEILEREPTDDIIEFSDKEILESLDGSIQEFGIESIPQTMVAWRLNYLKTAAETELANVPAGTPKEQHRPYVEAALAYWQAKGDAAEIAKGEQWLNELD